MTSPSVLFSRLTLVHCLEGRVRFRFYIAPGVGFNARVLSRCVAALHGVTAVRINGAARALVVNFSTELTSVTRLEEEILALSSRKRADLEWPERRQSWQGVWVVWLPAVL